MATAEFEAITARVAKLNESQLWQTLRYSRVDTEAQCYELCEIKQALRKLGHRVN